MPFNLLDSVANQLSKFNYQLDNFSEINAYLNSAKSHHKTFVSLLKNLVS